MDTIVYRPPNRQSPAESVPSSNVAALPYEFRKAHNLEDTCPGCDTSFGVTRDFKELWGKVHAHLQIPGIHDHIKGPEGN
jgi:hypothetical protein